MSQIKEIDDVIDENRIKYGWIVDYIEND